MKNNSNNKSTSKDSKISKGYDEGVYSPGSGLEDHGELIAPAALGDQLGPMGKPIWDESERAAPPASAAPDGQRVAVSLENPGHDHSLAELHKRAQALSIPGREKMTRMELAKAVDNATIQPHVD